MLFSSSLIITIFIASSPVSIGLWIILITLSISILLSYITLSWLRILIFLIYIGGILVIFAYFSALIPNQQIIISSILSTLIINILIIRPLFFIFNNINILFINISSLAIITSPYTKNSLFILILIIIILFIALVIVVKITTKINAPLRPFKYS